MSTESAVLSRGAIAAAVDGLNPDWRPYAMVSIAPHRFHSRVYGQRIESVDIATVEDLAEAGEWQFYLWSRVLSPWVDGMYGVHSIERRAVQTLTVNGLISINYQHATKSSIDPTVVGCVNCIETKGGLRVKHDEYASVYRTLVKRLRAMSARNSDGGK